MASKLWTSRAMYDRHFFTLLAKIEKTAKPLHDFFQLKNLKTKTHTAGTRCCFFLRFQHLMFDSGVLHAFMK